MITFTGLVFSITVVVLQLTSSQFSPRVLRTFLRDRVSQLALGTFVSTFVYAVLVLRTVDNGGTDAEAFVPALATTVGVGLLLLSVALFIAYIHHIATAIQASSIIAAIARETRQVLERRHEAGRAASGATPLPPLDLVTLLLPAPRLGMLISIDEKQLVSLAAEADVVLRCCAGVGEFVPEGAPLLEVLGDASTLDVATTAAALVQGRDRTMQQDVAFGLRQLVDIAERALSPGVNDPTTAVQALDQLHDLLRRLVTRPLRPGIHCDDRGRVRLVLRELGIEDYLALALDEIEQYGEDCQPVQRRVDLLLTDLRAAALPEHQGAVQERIDQRISQAAERAGGRAAPRG